MFQNNRPRYWVSWFDRWHLWLLLVLLLLACMALYLTMNTPAPNVTLSLANANTNLQSDKPVTLAGTAPANSTVRVYEAGKLIGETRADANGNYSLTLANLATGAHSLIASIELNGARIESNTLNANVNAAVAVIPPTIAPTATAMPPTATQVPPTATRIPPTATQVPPTATSAPSATPTLAAGTKQRRGKDNAEMVYVPASEFGMGDPAKTIFLNAFWLDKSEVTNEQFQQFVDATAYKTDAEKQGWGFEFVNGKWEQVRGIFWRSPRGNASTLADKQKHPVVLVSWNDATAYCTWAGKRLPTEAEWEKSARGTDGRAFPWGNAWDGTKLNFCDTHCAFAWKDVGANDQHAETAPVGSFPQSTSAYGANDLAGNVWEWTADWFDAEYYKTMPTRNPTGPVSGQLKILRGGAWSIDQTYTRNINRFMAVPEYRERSVGLRCAQ